MLAPRSILPGLLAASFLLASGEVAPLETYKPQERNYWAFKPRSKPLVPAFTNPADRAWTENPVDAFVLERLHKEGLRPAPEADRPTLIRRLYFDLTGLPPSTAEVDAFVNDAAPDAWPRLVERLLGSPRYGEKWGRHWLDLVRFAESDGFEYDNHRSDAWRYRDYVIRSFNEDKPYDRFVTEQLAGDEIAPGDEEMRVASGLQRLGPLRLNAGNQEVASSRSEVLIEMTNVVGAAFLGVTVGCARCHDHKFDPIRHSDYYRLQAYFAATHADNVPVASASEQASWTAKAADAKAEVETIRRAMKGLEGDARKQMAKKLRAAQEKMPPPLPALFSVRDDYSRATPIHILARGDYRDQGAAVGMRPLGVLLPEGTPERPIGTEYPRAELARWITDPENPLTARVMANRVWLHHFGRGIVDTPNDFGRMGGRPSHPELLDYLANWLVDGGWRLKPLHRLILLSNAYRQASTSPLVAAAMEKDPNNKLVWRYSRRRLEAEEIRDAALAVSGRLNTKLGGPSVIVPVDQELVNLLYKPSQWAVTPAAEEHDRRSVYLIAKRNLRLPFMEVFDAPDLQLSCARRESSTHAPQALELLNGGFTNQMADALAERLHKEAGDDAAAQVDLAYRLAASRPPNAREKELALEFLAAQPLREFALAVLNLNAFLYVN
ncbi:MAG: DUF1553 domain-containing protein [Bryobacteraceae bacterium]|nr:DUF1553 domain-containing protein [Bryobacteraceae bacterium]